MKPLRIVLDMKEDTKFETMMQELLQKMIISEKEEYEEIYKLSMTDLIDFDIKQFFNKDEYYK